VGVRGDDAVAQDHTTPAAATAADADHGRPDLGDDL